MHDARPPLKSILIVEDEVLIRIDSASEFRQAGWSVTEARNGDEARRLIDAGLTFDALLTDIQMPGDMNGLALAAYVRAMTTSVIAIATAYDPPGATPGVECDLVFVKPLDIKQVSQEIEARVRAGS